MPSMTGAEFRVMKYNKPALAALKLVEVAAAGRLPPRPKYADD